MQKSMVQVYADPPEKVLNMDPKIARGATSFYGQIASQSKVNDAEGAEKTETEKVHAIEPTASHEWAEYNWGIHKGGRGARTSFYS
tara:strand:+ start:348 stop:605 length:258 start_codon:yes stop_codon:yes gene_type:complete